MLIRLSINFLTLKKILMISANLDLLMKELLFTSPESVKNASPASLCFQAGLRSKREEIRNIAKINSLQEISRYTGCKIQAGSYSLQDVAGTGGTVTRRVASPEPCTQLLVMLVKVQGT